MGRIILYFLAALGAVFLLLVAVALYLFLADPFNLRGFFGTPRTTSTESGMAEVATTTDQNPLLSPAEEQALETAGIDPSGLPTEITPEMRVCFEAALGAERVSAIVGGETPTPTDFFRARHCIE